ncbi:Serpentine Receptor, class Z [Caenorhabditis elegans]|uniref:Serpentine Receptor, class Z n=1 Tax=Caenorhabditis elegans TaxID=6239 RepID=O44459_CAEEL|nr:Serpentine Receptor, class Z [Caenorhabditis elegans]CCD64021.1 Serpentine Receptor, class Z [Caenorhabditis elegans]|eukprot:NP_500358.2 Serpentine Receptor, class Z [Caenorhabditis elegans]
MNISGLLDDSEFTEQATLTAVRGLVAIFYFLMLLYLVIYPFYVYNFKLNRRKDKNALLFPTVNHFYHMVNISYSLFVLLITVICLAGVAYYHLGFVRSLPEQLTFVILVTFIIFAQYLCAEAFHLTIFLLAAQRLLVFFFPHTEKQVARFQKLMAKHIWYLYLVCFIKELALAIIFCTTISTEFLGIEGNPFGYYTMGFVALFYVLLFLSTAFYIPIMIRTRKFASIQNCVVNNYIHWQTLTVFICKSIAIVLFVYNNTYGTFSTGKYTFCIACSDIVTTPLIVQISYLGSNGCIAQPSASFKWKKFFRVLFNFEESPVVEPQREYY